MFLIYFSLTSTLHQKVTSCQSYSKFIKSKMAHTSTSQRYIQSPRTKYQVLKLSGSGTFGQVFKCLETNSSQPVAVKLQKHTSDMQGSDVGILLRRLNQENTDKYNLVKCFEWFHYNGHVCIVFEMLQQSLYQFIKMNDYVPLPLSAIRPIVQQILTGLGKLKELGIIHADLKPENIMFVNMENQPYRIKIIDFGNAGYCKDFPRNSYLQTRYYRAPEVILGSPFWEAIDMWSVGCIAAELFMGHPLYPGASSYDQLRYIVFTQGRPGKYMFRKASRREEFFCRTLDGTWKLKDAMHYAVETGVEAKEQRNVILPTLDYLFVADLGRVEHNNEVEKIDRTIFIDLVKCMLHLNPRYRATPMQALSHHFLCLNHLQEYYDHEYVLESRKMMDICYGSSSRDSV